MLQLRTMCSQVKYCRELGIALLRLHGNLRAETRLSQTQRKTREKYLDY